MSKNKIKLSIAVSPHSRGTLLLHMSMNFKLNTVLKSSLKKLCNNGEYYKNNNWEYYKNIDTGPNA